MALDQHPPLATTAADPAAPTTSPAAHPVFAGAVANPRRTRLAHLTAAPGA